MSELNAQNSEKDNEINNSDNNSNVEIIRKRKNNNNNMDSSMPKHYKNNYYGILDIENDKQCDQELLKQFEKHVKEKNEKTQKLNSAIAALDEVQRANKNISTTNNSTVVNITKNDNKKIPPINIVDIETKQLIDFLKKALKIEEFKIKEFRNKKSLFLNNLDDFLRVKAYLEKTKTNFFTFTPKGMKTKTYLLKGLDANISTEDILNELCKHQSDELQFIKVSPFSTKKSAEKGYSLPIFLVQVTPNSNVNQLKNIKAIFHRCVRWEQIRRPEITQCRNCQGFFHSAANCYLQPKCVKCNVAHEKGKCPTSDVPAGEKEKLYCVVCNKYGHPASYKGCEKYKELQDNLRAKKKILVNNRTSNNFNTFTNPETSFANVLRGNNVTNKPNDTFNNTFLVELKNMMINLSSQMANLQKQINLQTSRIDTIFSMVGV